MEMDPSFDASVDSRVVYAVMEIPDTPELVEISFDDEL